MTEYEGVDRRRGERTEMRFEARLKSGLRFSFDSSMSHADDISSVIVGDLSDGGMSTSATENLYVGAPVLLDVPLVGWRAATVMWIAGDRAGCRFAIPLTQAELCSAVTKNAFICDAFPGLAAQMSMGPAPASGTRRPRIDVAMAARCTESRTSVI